MNLNQVTVPSIDVVRSIKFYQTLGLKLIVHTHNNYARFLCLKGTSTFSVQKVDSIQKGNGIHIYFELENLDEQVDELITKGIKFKELPNDKPWLWREAHVLDPDGNHIILYFAGTNRVNPPWALKKKNNE